MSNSLGEAVLELSADDQKLGQQLDDTKKGVEGVTGKIEGAFQAIVTSAVLQMIAKTYKELITAGEEAAVTEAKVAGVIRATGNAAGYTVGELADMADEFSRITGFDDEVILNAEAILLTFRKIGKETFPEAMQAAIDMSAVLGTDLQGSILQVGKALNDPIQGVTALRRAGVSFTDDQMKMIQSLVDSNDLLGAQKVVLDELQAEFGGTAAEMEQASSGSKRLEVSVGNLKEEIGKGMLPAQRTWNYLLAETVDTITQNVTTQNEYKDAQREAINFMNQSGDAAIYSRAQFNLHRDEIERNTREIMRWSEIGAAWEQRLAAEGQLATDLGTALQEVDYKSLLDLTISLSKENQNFAASQEAVRTKQAEIQAEINNLLALGYSPLSQKVRDLQTDYDELGLRYDQNALKHKEATNQILYDLILQKLSVDGLTQDEYELALQAGLSLGKLDQGAVDTARNFDLVAQAVQEGKLKVDDMQKALDLLPTLKSIDVVINTIMQTIGGLHEQGAGGLMGGYASGTSGWMEVPSGFPNDTYSIGLSSGEMFSVIPSGGQAAGMDGNSFDLANMDLAGGGGSRIVPLQFIYEPFIGVNDEYEAKNKLRSIVNDLNREAERK